MNIKIAPYMGRRGRLFAAVAAGGLPLLLGVHGLAGQETRLTLDEAVERALQGNRSLAAQEARAEAARAGADGADAFLWPTLGAEAGATRSDDPVAVFGTLLRQGRFTESDFALDALNHPDAATDWTGGVGLEWDAVDPASWAGRSVARAEARAADLVMSRTREGVIYRTRILYLRAVQTDARLAAVRAAADAAEANRDLVGRREREGLLTEADVLRAEAALADVRARVVDAERRVADARARLALHLGLESGVELVPTDTTLDVREAAAVSVAGPEIDDRADVRASRAGVDAAEARRRQARMARLPTLGAFGALTTHAPGAFDDREAHATVGFRLQVPLFTGGALSAREDAAEAMARAVELEHRELLATARTEVEEARRGVVAARRGADAAEAASTAAAEASRLVRRRFEEGLATTADLLQSEAEAVRLRTAAVDARAALQMALATLDFALGTDVPEAPLDSNDRSEG